MAKADLPASPPPPLTPTPANYVYPHSTCRYLLIQLNVVDITGQQFFNCSERLRRLQQMCGAWSEGYTQLLGALCMSRCKANEVHNPRKHEHGHNGRHVSGYVGECTCMRGECMRGKCVRGECMRGECMRCECVRGECMSLG